MRRCLILVLLGLVVAAGGATDRDELERNRRLLERWRAAPEHYQRLQRDLKAFYALPDERRKQMRQFDRQLHETDLTTQTRLWAVLERFATWMDKLDEKDRARIKDAADPASKLVVIREIRDREWVERLPVKLRDEVLKIPPGLRPVRVRELREEERRQKNFWQKGTRSKDDPILRPSKMGELTPEARTFVEALIRRLNTEEKDRLDKAKDKWPEFPRTIRDLADVHPAFPPLPNNIIVKWAELPSATKKHLNNLPKRKFKPVQNASGAWPDYALEVWKVLNREKLTGPPLGASRLEEFPAETQTFVKTQLFPLLNTTQKEFLAKQEGKWPDYPQQLVRLARERQMLIPHLNLPPGPIEVWESARMVWPDVPDRLLFQFALHETSQKSRAQWELNAADPMGSRKKVKDEWYRQKLAEQERKKERATLSGEQ